ncbi:helix-hairpin-helix domain-containing protein [Tissierella carlieri]|uniref:Helix-hairpin-helix domain-containing protein n=1 Tax=Tissierella carlieri TaxID=689904 RepID=A0ABT1SB75_9FIRM|nr:helix-hairpin-helix domain-containing protein [Tissierella carlieri]MCQ4923739.1 helix-hairpin-helix domain-containing protein [Tissierella carlieri]
MVSFTKREQIVILLIVFTIILALGFKFFIRDIIESRSNTIEITNSEDEKDTEEIEDNSIINSEDKIIIVHISGQVYNPGIVELELGNRLIDAVKLAGGLKKDADIDRINLAKKLVDEEKIYIPKIGEDTSEEIEILATTGSSEKESGKININTCSKEDLISLPGIGETIAGRIIEYRSTNPFKSIEDIKNVSGIGDKKFEGIKELIIVN